MGVLRGRWLGGVFVNFGELQLDVVKNRILQCFYCIEIIFFRFKIENFDFRGIQLSVFFMSGVDMVLFVNDVCGQLVFWEYCCFWMYFDGKFFQFKLFKVSREKILFIDFCDGQVSCGNISCGGRGGVGGRFQLE